MKSHRWARGQLENTMGTNGFKSVAKHKTSGRQRPSACVRLSAATQTQLSGKRSNVFDAIRILLQ